MTRKLPADSQTANKWKRLATLSAGAAMNLITGILLFTFVISRIGMPQTKIISIASVESGSPAAIAGISAGRYH